MFKSTLPDDTEPSAEARQIADELLPKGFFADVRDLMSYRGMQDDCEDKLRRDFMFALDRFRAAGVREALEEAAALCESHAERRVKGIILAPELAGEFPDDGDELAPMLPDNGAVAAVANDLAKVRLHIAATGIRALIPAGVSP